MRPPRQMNAPETDEDFGPIRRHSNFQGLVKHKPGFEVPPRAVEGTELKLGESDLPKDIDALPIVPSPPL